MTAAHKLALLCVVLCLPCVAKAQWEVKLTGGAAFPLGRYGSIVSPGWIAHAEIKNRLKGSNSIALGAEIHAAFMRQDKDLSDNFKNSRLTIVPVLFTASYIYPITNRLSLSVTAGAGIAAYSFWHGTPPDMILRSSAEFVVSPQAGMVYKINSKLALEIEGNILWYPRAYVTGYSSITAGLSYRL
jgi:hypothetical protein